MPTSLISAFWPVLMSIIISPALIVPENTRT
jgi:hypothetical protein